MYKLFCMLYCAHYTCIFMYRLLYVCLQEVLLHPDSFLLLIHDAVFDDPDEVICSGPGVGLQAGVEAGNALQFFLFGPTQPHKLLLRFHAQRQLPVWTGYRKEAALQR